MKKGTVFTAGTNEDAALDRSSEIGNGSTEERNFQ